MNYIDRLAFRIYRLSGGNSIMTEQDASLYRIYAVLALAKGSETTREDVHDAWSAWQAGIDPEHRSLVPFVELSPEVQELDQPYVDAIHRSVKYNWTVGV